MAAELSIAWSERVPDETYFLVGDCEPTLSLDGTQLTIHHGKGSWRMNWGAPGVTSTLVLHAPDLVAVHVGYHHKHGGGQFWRFYRPAVAAPGGGGGGGDMGGARQDWKSVTWAALDDATRQRVLDAAAAAALPEWAKAPGLLRAQRPTPLRPARRQPPAPDLPKQRQRRLFAALDALLRLGRQKVRNELDALDAPLAPAERSEALAESERRLTEAHAEVLAALDLQVPYADWRAHKRRYQRPSQRQPPHPAPAPE